MPFPDRLRKAMPVLEQSEVIEFVKATPGVLRWKRDTSVDFLRKPYKKPFIKKETEMTFPTDIIRANSIVNCRQCSGCHGCR